MDLTSLEKRDLGDRYIVLIDQGLPHDVELRVMDFVESDDIPQMRRAISPKISPQRSMLGLSGARTKDIRTNLIFLIYSNVRFS